MVKRNFQDIFLKFIPEKSEKPKHVESDLVKIPINLKLQDKELQEMKDNGMCLSIHQPYASMLIQGIKQLNIKYFF